VLSAGSPAARREHAALQDWMDGNSGRLFVPTIVVAEIVSGIAGVRRAGALRRAAALEAWLDETLRLHAGRVVPFDVAAARATGLLQEHARATGQAPGFADLAIAGIAAARGLTILTRNLRHFAPLGVAALDPYVTLPA
jgi:predicted nucleic acid-binding protein